jgi:hypothetical protein
MSHLNQGPHTRFNELVSNLLMSLEIDGSDLLVAIGMLRERSLREEFLDILLSRGGNLSLTQSSYLTLVDLMRALLRESNNTGDHSSIASVFAISRMYGRSIDGFKLTVLNFLPKHEAWLNPTLWLNCTDELIANDILRWEGLPSKSRRLLLNIPESQVTRSQYTALPLIISRYWHSLPSIGFMA